MKVRANTSSLILGSLVTLVAIGAAVASRADDWSTFGAGERRVSTVSERLVADNVTFAPKWNPAFTQLDGKIVASPVVNSGKVYVGTLNQKFYQVDAATGAIDWEQAVVGRVYSTATVSQGLVYFGTDAGYCYCLDPVKPTPEGREIFRIAHGGKQLSSPLIADGKVILTRGEPFKDVQAYSLATRQLAWSYDTGNISYSSPSYYNGYVFVGSDNGRYFILNATDGALAAAPVATAGAVFLSNAAVVPDASNPNKVRFYGYPGDTDYNVYCWEWTIGNPTATLAWKYKPGEVAEAFAASRRTVEGSATPQANVSDDDLLVTAILRQVGDAFVKGTIPEAQWDEVMDAAAAQMNVELTDETRQKVRTIVQVNKSVRADSRAGSQASMLQQDPPAGSFSPTGVVRVGTPAVTEKYLVVATSHYGWPSPRLQVAAMNPLTGQTKWILHDVVAEESTLNYPAVAIATTAGGTPADPHHLAVVAVGNKIEGVYLEGKTVQFSEPVQEFVLASPAVASGAVYVGTVGGKLYGFGTENHPPTAPTNPAPGGEVNITDTNQPTFTWTMASDPDAFHAASDLTYVIEVTVEGQTNLFTVPGTQASFQYPAAIPIDSKVVWRVRARDPWNAESPWTLFQTFFINKDLTPPADVTNLVGIPVGDRVDLSWAPSASPDVARYGLSYRVESGAYGSEIDAGGATAKSVGGLSLNVVYVFRVRAYDRRENGSAGAELTVLTAPTDTVPPTLLSADFRDTTGAGEVGEATLTFSERVRDGSLTPAGFALNGAPATAFATGAAADDAVIVLKWSPAVAGTGNLALTYAPAVGGLTDLMGNPMAAITAGGFAAGDSVPPVVSSAFARDNAQPGPGPDADDTVVITFSEATNKAVINANNIDSTLSLSGGHTWLSANGSLTGADWSGDGATLTVRLSVAGGAPTVAVGDVLSVRGGLIKDTTGNAAGGTGVAISGLFEADAVPPQLLSATLLDTQRKGSIDQVRLRYTEPVQTATLRAGGVKVNGQAASAVVAGSAADTTVTVTLSPAVAGTGLAQVTYSAAAGALKDLGNNLAPDVPESATVEVDAAAPLLAGPVEVFDANGNGFLDRVEIPFTETMSADAAHRDIADLSLTDADGSTNLLAGRADAHLSVSVAKVTVTLADSSGTKGMPLYRFVENGNGKYIRDLAGNMPPSEGNGSRPVANAGPDQTAPPGVIIISGAGSTDADAGATLTYAWTQAGGQPVSLALPVAGGAGPGAQFLAVLPGTYLFSLTVSDGLFTSLPDSVAVTIQNVKPTAVGMNRTVFKDGDSTTRDLTLSAETSTDANSTPTMSDIVSYIFQQVAGPAPILPGAIAQAGGVGSPTAALDSDLLLPGVYTFEVTVTDRGNLSDTATFTVVVNGAGQTVPLADPGYDRAVERGQTVTLDASRSLDADGDVLTYRWRRVSGPALELSDATAIRPTFYAQELGACLFELMVDDGKAASLPKTVTITVVPRTSRVPLADAGTDVADARVGAEVKLDGTRSAVADGNIPSWLWEQTAGTVVELRDRYTPTPRFTPVQPGAYRFKVTLAITVNAENGEPVTYPASDTVDVTVSDPANAVPVAAVVTPVKGDKGQEARLDGSGSRDPENATLIWFWTQTAGVSVNLKNVASATPSFVPSVEGNYAFDLRVSDGRNFSQPVRAEVIVSGANHAPVLAFEVRLTPPEGGEARVASPDDLKAVVVNSQVLLDLSASSDPDNNALTWFVTQKSGEILTMDGAGRLVAVTPKKAGNYSFEVFVDDGKIHSAATTIAFTVITKDEVVAKQKDADQERRVTFTPVSESVSFCGATAHHAPPSADMRAEVERAAGLLLPAAGALLALLALRRRARLARAG